MCNGNFLHPPPAWNSEDSISFPFIEYFFGVFEGGCVVAFEVLPVNHNVARSLSATHTKARKGEMTLGGHFFTVCWTVPLSHSERQHCHRYRCGPQRNPFSHIPKAMASFFNPKTVDRPKVICLVMGYFNDPSHRIHNLLLSARVSISSVLM